jgi:hypothetical protein
VLVTKSPKYLEMAQEHISLSEPHTPSPINGTTAKRTTPQFL